MYITSMKQDIVEKKAAYPTELTEMQRRFCEYLIMNEGRTTRKEAAIKAGYAEKSAAQEAAGLIQNPRFKDTYRLDQMKLTDHLLLQKITMLEDSKCYLRLL